jgi:type IV pilus assembly protein PilW
VTSRHRAAPHRQRGLTLVEMLVSVSLGLLLLGAAVYVYFGSKGSYRVSKSTSRLQEAGHFGLEAMLRDVRAVGFIGCGSTQQTYPSANSTAQIYQIANPPLALTSTALTLAGYAPNNYSAQGATLNWPNQPAGLNVPWLAGDVVTLRIAMGVPTMMSASPAQGITGFYLPNNCANLAKGNYVIVSNCSSATLARISNSPPSGAAGCPANRVVAGGVKIDHGASNNSLPASWFGQPIPANWPLQLNPPNGYQINAASLAQVQQFDEVTYYVGQLPGNVRPPALYRYSATAGVAEEIMDHIENMVVLYGVNLNGTVTCQTATELNTANNWANVVSVRATLVAVGDEQSAVDTPQSFNLGTCDPNNPKPVLIPAPAASDKRLREIFTGTAALRDRLP